MSLSIIPLMTIIILHLFSRIAVALPPSPDSSDSDSSGSDSDFSRQDHPHDALRAWCEAAYSGGTTTAEKMFRLWNAKHPPEEGFVSRRSFLNATRKAGFRFRRSFGETLQIVNTFNKPDTAFAHAGHRVARRIAIGTVIVFFFFQFFFEIISAAGQAELTYFSQSLTSGNFGGGVSCKFWVFYSFVSHRLFLCLDIALIVVDTGSVQPLGVVATRVALKLTEPDAVQLRHEASKKVLRAKYGIEPPGVLDMVCLDSNEKLFQPT